MKNFIIITTLFLISSSFSYGKDNKTIIIACEKKCGDAPRLIDLPDPSDRGYDSFLYRANAYNMCTEKCDDSRLKKHVDKRVKELENQPTESHKACNIKCDPHGTVLTHEKLHKSRQASEEGQMAWIDLIEYYGCMDACKKPGEASHTQVKMKKLPDRPTIDLLQKELSACDSQLALIQEKEPSVYNKLKREFKNLQEYYNRDATDTGAGAGAGAGK